MESKILNQHQEDILKLIDGDDYLSKAFYFSGGTALSLLYLKHRESVDLDFFSLESFDPQGILSRITAWSKKLKFTVSSQFVDPTHIYFLKFPDGQDLKVDFAQYPYKQLEPMKKFMKRLMADSLIDIAANKLLTLTQRSEVKDYTDVYFLLNEYTFWDLKGAVAKKFNIEIDPYSFAADCMTVEDFTYLPKMIKPLSLGELKKNYIDLAKKLGKEKVQ